MMFFFYYVSISSRGIVSNITLRAKTSHKRYARKGEVDSEKNDLFLFSEILSLATGKREILPRPSHNVRKFSHLREKNTRNIFHHDYDNTSYQTLNFI